MSGLRNQQFIWYLAQRNIINMIRSALLKRTQAALLHQTQFELNITKFAHQLQPVLSTAPVNRPPHIQSTTQREQYRHQHKIKFKRSQKEFQEDWTRGHHNRVYTEKQAMTQANRCMKCADSPCQKACSTGIDIRQFIYMIQNQNYYGAAKTILSDNPLGLSCGGLCPVSELCASTCNAHWLEGGTIQIGKLQEFALKVFKQMKVKQIRDPNLKPLPESVANIKIALIGAGSASLSCAAYLGRLGYKNVHIYEKTDYSGGLVTSQIPPNRSNYSDIEWEADMVKELGVKFIYGKTFGKDFTEESLKKDGYQAIFIGTGLDHPKTQLGKEIYMIPNVFSSKTFLPNVCINTKISKEKQKIFKLHGHVVVLGIGDTAIDCARSALRMGAERVTLLFRRGFEDLRANDELFNPALYENINFISNLVPLKVNKQGQKATGVQCAQFVIKESKEGKNEYAINQKQKVNIDADFIITAFGSQNSQSAVKSALFEGGKLAINKNTMQHTSKPHIFAGGDILGTQNLVDAVNDGKVASWYLHKHLSKTKGFDVGNEPKLPGFFTQIDLVDVSVEMANVKFKNPFGLASAPPTTSYPMIRRAFELGWGFAVTKTFVLDKDEIVNVSPRIFKATNNPLRTEASFSNIELISQKRARYWVEGAKQLKKDFPDRVIVGSIMASYSKDDWHALAKMCKQANFDVVQLNLSCNHGMPDKGMGRACSDVPEVVQQITRWVKEYVDVPVFIKLSPNSTINQKIAEFVKRAGGAGVSATNTMYSLMDPEPSMDPYPAVGKNKHVYYGGAAGSVLRPIAMRVASTIANNPDLKGVNIMATGGIINSQHALAYTLYGGASVYQICSAVQEQDFSIINDLITGFKALLYLSKREDLKKNGWKGQSPPVLKMQKLKKYQNEFDLWPQKQSADSVKINSVPRINELKAGMGNHIFHINQMDKDQKFPVINDDLCVNCGKCYLTCLDSGYQAIKFETHTHKPQITSDCTGCGLCYAVCPVPGALLYEQRPSDMKYEPNRGDKYFRQKH